MPDPQSTSSQDLSQLLPLLDLLQQIRIFLITGIGSLLEIWLVLSVPCLFFAGLETGRQ